MPTLKPVADKTHPGVIKNKFRCSNTKKYFRVDPFLRFLNWADEISAMTKKIPKGIGILRYEKIYLLLPMAQAMRKKPIEPHFRS